MVMRYWGERQVYPEDFATLVDRGASGIRTDVLASEASRRGWQALPFSADVESGGEWIRGHIDRGRPVIALIEVRPDRYHYLVIVAWTGEGVVVHDPALGPFRVLSLAEFDRAWAAAGRWALLLSPEGPLPERQASSISTVRDVSSPADPCGALVRETVELAGAGDVGGAEKGLVAAIGLCPHHPAAWRELAGVRFLQARWAEAATLAERAALLEPSDEQGWDLLATSRFLDDEPDAALEAWNRIGRPSVDLVSVEGARRTRHPVVTALVNLPPRTLLTPERFGRAARRLGEIPSAAVTRLRYRPVDGGARRGRGGRRRAREAATRCRADCGGCRTRVARARDAAGGRRADGPGRVVDRRVAMVGGPSATRVRVGRAGALRAARDREGRRDLGTAIVRDTRWHAGSGHGRDPGRRAPARGVEPRRLGHKRPSLGGRRRVRPMGRRQLLLDRCGAGRAACGRLPFHRRRHRGLDADRIGQAIRARRRVVGMEIDA